MRKVIGLIVVLLAFGGQSVWAQGGGSAPVTNSMTTPPKPGAAVYSLDDGYLPWPIAASEQAYAAIDGKHLHTYVEQLAAISEHYRDSGHPQYWGRIEGTSGDAESAQWVADKFKAAGLEVRIQSFDLPPQWMPDSWEVTATGNGKTVNLSTAFPGTRSPGTTGGGIDAEAVYVGLGYAADFAGKDVRGKAVLIYSIPQPGIWANSAAYNGAVTRAENAGAVAVFLVVALPGNVRYSFPVSRNIRAARPGTEPGLQPSNVPEFTLGLEEAESVRQMIEDGAKPRIKLRLDAKDVPGLKTSSVWGILPGMSDEKVIVIAHRDGYFDAAGDNASGVATLVGLAEYFAKIPREKRPRTLEFVGTAGHHGTAVSVPWMAENAKTALAKTALVMNAEHMALTQPYYFAGAVRMSNATTAEHWNFNGSEKLVDIAKKALADFGVTTYQQTDGVAFAEISAASRLVPSFGVINVDTYYHSDHETPAMVPWTGLGSVTRAFAKIIDDVNKVEIRDLLPPGMNEIDASAPHSTTTAGGH
jgi:hypothetical protein